MTTLNLSSFVPAPPGNPKVSIVIDNYNYGQYLAVCIESALAQDYRPCEVVVVDDGSTDSSADVIRSYHEKIIPILKGHGGQASALNAGFASCSGEIVIFLDSDDFLLPCAARKIVESWRPGASKTQFNLYRVDGDGKRTGQLYREKAFESRDLSQKVLRFGSIPSMPMSGNAYGRSVLESLLPMTEVGWERGPDVYLSTMAALMGEVISIEEPLGNYRQHRTNASTVTKGGRLDIGALSRRLARERLTDESLVSFCGKSNLIYSAGTITRSAAHVQLNYITRLLNSQLRIPNRDMIRMVGELISALFNSELPLHKKIATTLWSLSIALSFGIVRERIVVLGFRLGLSVGVDKRLVR